MKIIIIGPKSKENQMLIKAAKLRGHEVVRASISQLSFILENNDFNIYFRNKDVKNFDICLIRGINPYFAKAKTLAKYLHRHKIPVIDRELYKKVYAFDKIFMYSALNYHKVPCPNTYYYFSTEEYQQSKNKFSFPVILKDVHGMHGRNIFIIKTQDEFDKFFKKNKFKDYFIQKFIDNDFYYRVLTVNGKALGAMKRYTLKVTKSKDIPLAKRSFSSDMTEKMEKIALKAAKATNADIAGVDLIFDEKNNPYILEVNRSPQFKRFTQKNKIDVAGEIIKYLETLS